MERFHGFSPFKRVLLGTSAASAAIFSLIYLLRWQVTSPQYILGTGSAALCAVCLLFEKEVFDRKKKNDLDREPSPPGRGAKFSPYLTPVFFLLVSILFYGAGLMT
jgi:hypothetical protein